jgi:hypothetical protein
MPKTVTRIANLAGGARFRTTKSAAIALPSIDPGAVSHTIEIVGEVMRPKFGNEDHRVSTDLTVTLTIDGSSGLDPHMECCALTIACDTDNDPEQLHEQGFVNLTPAELLGVLRMINAAVADAQSRGDLMHDGPFLA